MKLHRGSESRDKIRWPNRISSGTQAGLLGNLRRMRLNTANIRHCGKWATWVGFIAFLLVGGQFGSHQILCISADGSMHMETAGSGCCPTTQYPSGAARSGDSGIDAGPACCIDCRDVPVEQLCNLPQALPVQQAAPSFVSVLPTVFSGDLRLDHFGHCPITAFADAPGPLPLVRSVLRC